MSLSAASFHVRSIRLSLGVAVSSVTLAGAVSSAFLSTYSIFVSVIVFSLIETVATLTGLFSIPSLIAIAFTVASFVNSTASLYSVLSLVGNVPSVV